VSSATTQPEAVTIRPSPADISRIVRGGVVTVGSRPYWHAIFLELEGREVVLRAVSGADELHVFVDGRWAGDAGCIAAPEGRDPCPHPVRRTQRRHATSYREDEQRSLDGARLVETENYILCDDAIAAGAEDLEMVACFGEAGLGKTYATERATIAHAERLGMRHVHVKPRESMSGGALVGALLEQLFDVHVVRPSTRGPQFALLVDELSERTLVHIDEAQYLSANAMHILRHIDDLSHVPVCCVLSGGNTFWKVLSSDPMLKDRVPNRVPFRRFRSDEIPAVVRAFHPMFDVATDEQLLRLDELYAHGVFRAWRHIARRFQRHQLDPACDADHDKALIRLGARSRGT
jgi:AAA domain